MLFRSLRSISFTLNRKSLEKLYISYIRPLLEYADVLWHNCSASCSEKLEKVQISAARVVTGATRHVSTRLLLEEVGWESLSSRREKHKLVLMYKIMNGLSPSYLESRLPPEAHNYYNLRHVADIPPIYSRTTLRQKSFFPATIDLWNNLDIEIRNSETLSIFKARLRRPLVVTPKHYFVGCRKGQILHTRLRLECSSLNDHLFKHNLVDNCKCACGHPRETTTHFFFHCTLFNRHRLECFRQIPRVFKHDTSTFLFGDTHVAEDQNCELFTIIQKYIMQTKRF